MSPGKKRLRQLGYGDGSDGKDAESAAAPRLKRLEPLGDGSCVGLRDASVPAEELSEERSGQEGPAGSARQAATMRTRAEGKRE